MIPEISFYLIYLGLSVIDNTNEVVTLPCSPLKFINSSAELATAPLKIITKRSKKNEVVGYDFDNTIYVTYTFNKSNYWGFNKKIIQYIIDDLKQGKKIYIISNRNESDRGFIKKTITGKIGEQLFSSIHTILLGGTHISKKDYIMIKGIKTFYGDSDSDIENAILGGAHPIRVLRSIGTHDSSGAHIGQFDEDVLSCSHIVE